MRIGSPYVKLKMKYLEGQNKSGDQWYTSEGVLATNQAIKFLMVRLNKKLLSLIRNKDDRASVFLIDSRFGTKEQMNLRPKWVKSSNISFSYISDVVNGIKKFNANESFQSLYDTETKEEVKSVKKKAIKFTGPKRNIGMDKLFHIGSKDEQ